MAKKVQLYTTQYLGEVIMSTNRRYGFWNFVGDVIMTVITGGLWLIWVFVREMRNR